MFSPSQNSQPPARSSRRRQRPSTDSISQPKAKRQRSALSHQTFIPPDGSPDMEETRGHRVATLSRQESARELPGPQKEIAVRGKKQRSADRGAKGDGTVILTANDIYSVNKLPALPDRLRADVTSRLHGAIYSEGGYALALTHTHAIVWPYAVNIPSPETFTFALPQPSKHVSDPLPLGSLVTASASSSDPGLVVVVPTNGKITYWESISIAATLDLRLQRNGVETSIPGMFSGETVLQLLNAESAGFVLAFSSGRMAYMSVRDGQGKPAISVQFLRSGMGPVSGGIFGSLRNALSSSSWRGDIAAVRAAPHDKIGERNVVVATAKGKIQSWNMHRGGHASLIAEAEGREALQAAIQDAAPALSTLLESFEILDFTYTPDPITQSQFTEQEDRREDGRAHLLLLTSVTDQLLTHYLLVEVVLERNEMQIGNIRPMRSYTTPVSRTSTTKPRLYLPNPALVAYVVFDRAVIVLSMARQPDSPGSQLRAESRIFPQSFEDVIDLREDMNVEIIGSGTEEPHGPPQIDDTKSPRYKAKHPAVVLLVRGGGIVRIAATDLTKLTSRKAQQVTAKSKLEQAIFFGTMERNPLSFAVRPELQFTPEEVAAAALELSVDILKSETPYIPSVPASVDQNLQKRSAALQHLAEHLKDNGVALDRVTRWRLLWDAEKMKAATIIWKHYDSRVKEKPIGQKRGLLTEVVEYIHEDYKTEPVPEAGELDRVRHWFIKDIWNLEIAVPWAYQVIKYAYQDGQKDHDFVINLLSEANDLVLGALQSAFEFRTANLVLYGLEAEPLNHGVLETGYEELPEIWTSTIYVTENVRKQANLAGGLLKEYWNKSSAEGLSSVVLDKVRLEYSALIDVAIRSNRERVRWDSAQESPQSQIEADQIKSSQISDQEDQITLLATDLELSDAAIALAEKHELLSTLAEVLQFELQVSRSKVRESGLSPEEFSRWGGRAELIRSHIRDYFVKFGKDWATALYEYEISLGSMTELLDDMPDDQDYLTDFLRSRPEYAKLAWIQEVTRGKNYVQASRTLLDLGLKREQDLWSKKIELSMGKLALLAGQNYSQSNGIFIPDGGKAELASTHDELGLIKIQDEVYDFVLPSIETAIDENAEVQLALESHGNKSLNKQQTFVTFLEESMARLVKHEAMDALTLIDLLTLMGDEQGLFRGAQFYLAIKATCYGLDKDEQLLVQRIIWRRCMLRDDWAEVNDTALKDDQQVSEQLSRTALYLTFRACFKNRLFDKDSTVKPIGPLEVLGAGTEELDHRFNNLDASITERITKDMQADDIALRPYIETCRLDKWYQTALELAKDDFDEELKADTTDGKNMKQAEKMLVEIERDIKEKEQRKADSLLHSKPRYKPKAKFHGSTGNFRSSIKL